MEKILDLRPAILNLNLYAGDGEDFQVSFVDELKQAVDVSMYDWTSQIRELSSSTEFYDLSIDASDAANGNIIIHISAEVTSALPKTSKWDLQCTSEDRIEPVTLLRGDVLCEKDITRPEEVTP